MNRYVKNIYLIGYQNKTNLNLSDMKLNFTQVTIEIRSKS